MNCATVSTLKMSQVVDNPKRNQLERTEEDRQEITQRSGEDGKKISKLLNKKKFSGVGHVIDHKKNSRSQPSLLLLCVITHNVRNVDIRSCRKNL